jgi:hypothetical protein
MLSFTEGKPIALICGGKYDRRVLRLTEEKDEPDRTVADEDMFDILAAEDLMRQPGTTRKTLRTIDQKKLERAILTGQEPIDELLVGPYHRARAKIGTSLKKEFSMEQGTMVILPDPQSERIFIAGKSGSGKSCLAALYMNEYLRMFPDRHVFLVSRHEGEKAYAQVPHEVLPLDDFEEAEKGERVYELEDLKDSLIVFDDCDNVQNKRIQEGVKLLSDDLISNGRKYNIHVVWLNHQLMDYSRTRNLLNEANKVIFFNSGSNYHIQQYLTRYVGLNKQQIEVVLALRSRWTMVSLTLPMYIMYEHGAFLLR